MAERALGTCQADARCALTLGHIVPQLHTILRHAGTVFIYNAAFDLTSLTAAIAGR